MRHALAARMARWIVALLGATWRVEVVGSEHLDRLTRSGQAFVYAVWHRSLVPLVWWHRGQGVTLLVSGHADGGVLARVARRWGYRLLRGSSTRDGGHALRGAIRALRRGRPVAITPDGPRGPAGKAKPGAMAAARGAGVPILPMGADASRSWRIGSWDGLVIPYPFARVRIVYLEPLTVDRADRPSGAALDAFAGRLDRAAGLAAARRHDLALA